jgi:hypothetical protein
MTTTAEQPAELTQAEYEATTAEISAAGLRSMYDSAFPGGVPLRPVSDAVLIYAGGDTPHPWKTQEILAMPERFRWPCWVRSNPTQVSAEADASLFAAWLHGHHVPMGTCVILDLETAVDAIYVERFNLVMRRAGWKVTKYGSQSTIWQNPKTDGGTYLALPGPAQLTGEGDEVARQYGFMGGFDLSVLKDQAALPIWDTRPPKRGPYRHTGDGKETMDGVLARRHTTLEHVLTVSYENETRERFIGLLNYVFGTGTSKPVPDGQPYWTTNP